MNEFELITDGVIWDKGKNLKCLTSKMDSNDKKQISSDSFSENNKLNINHLNFFGDQLNSNQSKKNTQLKHKCINPISNQESSNNTTINISKSFKNYEEVEKRRTINKVSIDFVSECLSDSLDNLPFPIKTLDELELHLGNNRKNIIERLKHIFKIKKLTIIQQETIPLMLANYSVVSCAPTGSGKTLSYLIPILCHLKAPSKKHLRSLVILPSRELAFQVLQEFNLLVGNAKFKSKLLEKRTTTQNRFNKLDFAVTTPLKLVTLLQENQVNFNELSYLVLDEADTLLSLNFASQLDTIFSYVNRKTTQVSFFSATFESKLLRLVTSICPDAIKITIGKPLTAPSKIDQQLVFVTYEHNKIPTFRNLISNGTILLPVLVFVQSIQRAEQLFSELVFDGYYVEIIHGNLKKKQRDVIVQAFREKKIWVLISTDLMSRGIDFKGIQSILNWDIPQSSTSYIHRIGRTGRADHRGKALTFVTADDLPHLKPILSVIKASKSNLPEWSKYIKKNSKQISLFRKKVNPVLKYT